MKNRNFNFDFFVNLEQLYGFLLIKFLHYFNY